MHEYNICYALDSNYTEQLSVSLVSILKNSTKEEKFNVYVLDGGLTDEDKQKITELKEVKDFNLNFVRVNPKDFKECPLLKNTNKKFDFYHVTLPTYFRFKLPSLLPNVDKILYLDCDILARTPLEELYNTDVKKYATAMISDVESEKEAKRLNIKKYYNAGVMLLNLDYWRKNDIEKKLFDYTVKNKKTILWQDQDIINVVLQNEIKEVDLKWNYSYFLYDKINEEDLKKSAIIHFAGRFKPWTNPIDHPLFDFYYYYLLLTPFKSRVLDYKLNVKGKYLKDNIGGTVTNILVKSSDVDLNEKTKEIYDYTDKAVKDSNVHLSIETDEKIQKLLPEIKAAYDYVNKLVEDTATHIAIETDKKLKSISKDIKEIYLYSDKTVKESELVQKTQTDEKITAVYAEITKNYDYTKEEINKSQDKQKIETDEKISSVYDEISKNYEYTKEIVNELGENNKKDINLLDELIKKSNEELDKKIRNIEQITEQNYSFIKDKSTHLSIETDEKIQKLLPEIKAAYEYVDKTVKDSNVHLSIETDEKIQKLLPEIKATYEYVDKTVKDSNVHLSIETDEKIQKLLPEIKAAYEYVDKAVKDKGVHLSIETDEKIQKLLPEIKAAYEYVNKLVEDTATHIAIETDKKLKSISKDIKEIYLYSDKTVKESELVQKTQTDEKITAVYAEITKNYDYTKEEINKSQDKQKIETDEKISSVYDEISKNYEYTKEIVNELGENNKKDINLLDELIKKSNEELDKKIRNIEQTNERNDSFINSVNDCLNNKIDYISVNADKKTELLKSDIEKIKDENNVAINLLNEIINQKSDDFNKLLEEKETLFKEELNKISDEQKRNEEVQKETQTKLEQNRIELYTYIDNQNAEKCRETDNKVQSVRDFFADELEKFEQSQNLKIRETVTEFNCETAKLYSDMQQNINIMNEKINNTQNDVYSRYSENKYNIETIKNEYVSKTLYENERNVSEAKYLQAEEEYNEKIRKVIADCEIMLNEQRKKYEKKLMKLEEKLEFIENQYQNRNFFTRMFNKYIKR